MRILPQADLDTLIALVASKPEGMTFAEVVSAAPEMPRRNLQRRLAALVGGHQLVRDGQGPTARYRRPQVITAVISTSQAQTMEATGTVRVPVSPEAAALREELLGPIQARTPVGYRREFLDAYEPGVTAWLGKDLRQQLQAVAPITQHRMAGTYSRALYERLLIELSWNSSRLEGNTYSLLETQQLIELGAVAAGQSAADTQMILNHKRAIEYLLDPEYPAELDRHTVLSLHSMLSDNLLPDPNAGGRLRTQGVGITSSVFVPLAVPQLIEEAFDEILRKAVAIPDPFEQALFLLVQLPYLQPFDDVNKRVSRLAANIPLIAAGYCPLSFVDVPEGDYVLSMLAVYELKRIELARDVFAWAYQRSAARYAAVRQSLGDPDPFRLRYRGAIGEAVRDLVRERVPRPLAPRWIRQRALSVPEQERVRFQEMVETDLINLHEGNIARFELRPSEFRAWRAVWAAGTSGEG